MALAKYIVTVDTSKGVQMAEKLLELVMAGIITEAQGIHIIEYCINDLCEIVY
jgi:hypothetical protein